MDLTCSEEMLSETDTPNTRNNTRMDIPDETLQYIDETSQAYVDPSLLHDPRVLSNLLKLEDSVMPSYVAYKISNPEITPEMRQSVATWMYEVCEEERCPEGVFLRAINYLDRFLSVHKIERTQFQLLGAACMLISSKWIGSVLSTDRLIFYTANSITLEMLLEWEMMILTQFKWDMFTIIPTDFMEHLLHRLPQNLLSNLPHVRETAKTYTAFCATDHNFCIHPPSMIAAATIAASIGHHVSPAVLNDVLHRLHEITRIELDVLRSCMDKVKAKIPVTISKENLSVPGVGPGSSQMMGADKLGELEQAETPTDVGDIQF